MRHLLPGGGDQVLAVGAASAVVLPKGLAVVAELVLLRQLGRSGTCCPAGVLPEALAVVAKLVLLRQLGPRVVVLPSRWCCPRPSPWWPSSSSRPSG